MYFSDISVLHCTCWTRYRLITKDTIEEHVMALQHFKLAVSEGVVQYVVVVIGSPDVDLWIYFT